MAAPPPTPVERFIHEVQGDGPSSPLLGEAVTIQGVVVGDLQEANELNGFFVQEETTDEDGNPATSEGIFVYCGADGADCADVAIGNLVTVSGNVDESNGQTQLDNDTGILEVVVEDTGNLLGLRTPATADFPLGVVTELEAFEGMTVEVASDMRAVELFNFDRFSEIRVWTDGTGATLACPYPAAGSYEAVGVIRDNTGLSSRTNVVPIDVISTADAFDSIRGLVDGLDGLNRGQTKALNNKLRNAERQYGRGRLKPALAQLDAALVQLQSFTDKGYITAEERLLVADAVTRLMASIG